VALSLVARCDVVLESYTSGAMAKLGLAYQDLVQVKSDLIMLSSCMYGQSGDLRSMPGYGMPLTALCGLTHLTGWPDRAPCGPYGAYTDYLVPRLNLLAIAAALDHRQRTGRGVYMDAAQLEAGAQFVAPVLLQAALTGEAPTRVGNQDSQAAPHGVYPCAGRDRWVASPYSPMSSGRAWCGPWARRIGPWTRSWPKPRAAWPGPRSWTSVSPSGPAPRRPGR